MQASDGMRVRVDQARDDEFCSRLMSCVRSAFELEDVLVLADGHDAAAAHGQASWIENWSSTAANPAVMKNQIGSSAAAAAP